MQNKIVNDIIKKRQGHYCHALEVNGVWELQACIDSLYDEFYTKYTISDIIEFFNTIELYCLDDINEDDVYNFNIVEYIKQL